MIKNLVVSGCSFTDDSQQPTWVKSVADIYKVTYHNLARGGAGNSYICNSVIDHLETGVYNPEETLVLVMWSGTSRKDIRVSEKYWNKLKYYFKFKSAENNYYVGSCGTGNAWQDNKDTRALFEMQYLSSDAVSLCNDSVRHFINLENYLKSHNYKFKFTGFYNLWKSSVNDLVYVSDVGEPLLGKYAQEFNLTNWFFIDENRNSLWEFAKQHNMKDDHGWHPSAEAHKLYAENIVVPTIEGYFK